MLKKKINILRSTFKRENNKVNKLMVSGSGTDKVYVHSDGTTKKLNFCKTKWRNNLELAQ